MDTCSHLSSEIQGTAWNLFSFWSLWPGSHFKSQSLFADHTLPTCTLKPLYSGIPPKILVLIADPRHAFTVWWQTLGQLLGLISFVRIMRSWRGDGARQHVLLSPLLSLLCAHPPKAWARRLLGHQSHILHKPRCRQGWVVKFFGNSMASRPAQAAWFWPNQRKEVVFFDVLFECVCHSFCS